MRTYRTGEVPDIGLSALDFFAPLEALAQNDPLVAKHVLVHLYEAIRTQRLDANAQNAQRDRLHKGVVRLLRLVG